MAWRDIGLSTRVWNNNLRCGLLLAGFPLLLALGLYGLALILATGEAPDLPAAMADAARAMPTFLALGGLFAGLWFLIAWGLNQRILDGVTGARPVTRAEEPLLWNTLEALCISRGEKMPRLAVMEVPELNAFASGLSRETGAVTVTRGLLEALEPAELRAVLAHELAHIRGGDARLGVIAAIFAGILTFLAEMLFRGGRRAIFLPRRGTGGNNRGNGAAMLLGVLVIAAAAALAVALRFALSRNREFQADAEAVRLTGEPDAMIMALRRIEGRTALPALPSLVRAMLLDDAALSRGPSLWATHPPITARVEALVRFAGGVDPGPLPPPPPPVNGSIIPAVP